jgi:hypothetical protein
MGRVLRFLSPFVVKLHVARWRHAVAQALKLHVPRAHELVKEIPRWQHVYGAITSLIQSTDALTRYAICREGAQVFQDRSKLLFRDLTDCTFDANELRLIWEGINSWRLSFEGHAQAELARRYELSRKRSSYDVEDETAPDPQTADVLVENVEDGMLKRRAVLGGQRIVH